ncbi:MAG: hypothetical protein J5891_03360 [Spirochaetales bacterium]|nr:hypothetical protein [Spirochaetales bacterium]
MKKVLAIVLLVALVMGAAFAQSIRENPEGMSRIIILNNSFEGLEATRQCYNAKEWHKSYNMGEIIDRNLWFTPADDIEVSAVHIGDAYRNITSLKTFRGKYVSFVKDNPAYEYDLFVGPNQKESEDVWYKDYVVIGNEALVFMPEEGIEDLVTYAAEVGLVPATGFIFTAVNGDSVTLTAEQLVDAKIVYDENRVITLVCGDTKLAEVKEVLVEGTTKDSVIEGKGVYRMVMLLNADGVYGVDAPYLQNRAGTWYPTSKTADHKYAGCYSVAELFDKFDVTPVASVYVESYVDGFGRAENYADFIQKYIGWHATAEYITMGQHQSKKEDAVWNAGYYILQDESFVYVPEAGLNVAAAFERIGMADVLQYRFTYADGKVELKYAEEIPGLVIDADSNLVTIEAQ